MNVDELISEISNTSSSLEGIKRQKEKEEKKILSEIEEIKKTLVIREKTEKLLKNLLDNLINENVNLLSSLVNQGLELVITDQKVGFKAEIQHKKDLWIKFITTENGIEGDVLSSFGGALACLESFILRIICVLKLKLRRILILDEVFSQVSIEYLENTSLLIKKLCDQFNIDLLLITHQNKLLKHADNVYNADVEIKNNEKTLILKRDE